MAWIKKWWGSWCSAKSVIFRKSLGKFPNDQKKKQALYPSSKQRSTRELLGSLTNVASTFSRKITEQVLLEAMSKQTKDRKVIKNRQHVFLPQANHSIRLSAWSAVTSYSQIRETCTVDEKIYWVSGSNQLWLFASHPIAGMLLFVSFWLMDATSPLSM